MPMLVCHERPTAAWVKREGKCLESQGPRRFEMRDSKATSKGDQGRVSYASAQEQTRAHPFLIGKDFLIRNSILPIMALCLVCLGRVLTARSAPGTAGRATPALVGDSRRSSDHAVEQATGRL